MVFDGLRGRVALVTGASGGIGRAIAEELGHAGAAIAVHCHSNTEAAAGLADALQGQGGRAEVFQAALADTRDSEALVDAVVARLGALDVLVNNAGAVTGDHDFRDMTDEEWDRTIALNLKAPFFLARAAFRAMEARGGGRIINISSVGARFGGSARSMHYGAAKAGLEAVTVALARAGAPAGILVNVVRPGLIDTPFHGRFAKDMAARIDLIPLKRMGEPVDVARMVAFLASDAGRFVTGQIFSVSGGE
jgi:3-oxoacyl-[acyl-carrier protein] reductase